MIKAVLPLRSLKSIAEGVVWLVVGGGGWWKREKKERRERHKRKSGEVSFRLVKLMPLFFRLGRRNSVEVGGYFGFGRVGVGGGGGEQQVTTKVFGVEVEES